MCVIVFFSVLYISHCLIYHIGGVSLDATVLLIQDGMFTVLNTFHKYDLGGTIFTEQLAAFLKSEFQRYLLLKIFLFISLY